MPPENKVDKAEFLAEQLALGLGEVKKIVEGLRTELQSERLNNAGLKSDIQHLNSNVEKLNKIVLDVHSSDSLAARLITLEKTVEQDKDVRNEEKKEEIKGKWTLRTVLVTGVISIISIILNIIFKK